MPRPRKCRRVCCLPWNASFGPTGAPTSDDTIVMSVDEYETIRLIDKEDMTQEECGEYMRVARTTVQQIYNSARKKIADALVHGLAVKIEGGDYHLCDGKEKYCACGGCEKHKCIKQKRSIEI